MNLKIVSVGELQTNCYILEKKDQCIIIDPGDELNTIEQYIDKEIIGIIITHNHYDHIGAVKYFKDKYSVNVYDYNNLREGQNNIGEFYFDVIYTPGHTNDSISIYIPDENMMFVGDFIFYRSIGRTDLPTGSYIEMQQSIEKIKKYDNINIYPGHGQSTMLNDEKKYNIYFS